MIPFQRFGTALLPLTLLLAAGSSSFAATVPKISLNDTGVTLCRNAAGNDTAQCAGTGQDGEFGRDVTANNAADGNAGFSFTKVCNSGKKAGVGTCPVNPEEGSKATNWGCTLDNRTGLLWEIKTTDGGLRDATNTYTNFADLRSGDASEFVKAVNAVGACGSKAWRLPTRYETQSLVDYSVAAPGPTIDLNFFPNAVGDAHWTSSAYAGDAAQAWGAGFGVGAAAFRPRSDALPVMLVKGAAGL